MRAVFILWFLVLVSSGAEAQIYLAPNVGFFEEESDEWNNIEVSGFGTTIGLGLFDKDQNSYWSGDYMYSSAGARGPNGIETDRQENQFSGSYGYFVRNGLFDFGLGAGPQAGMQRVLLSQGSYRFDQKKLVLGAHIEAHLIWNIPNDGQALHLRYRYSFRKYNFADLGIESILGESRFSFSWDFPLF